MSVVLLMVLAWVFLSLSRWGRRTTESLVPAHLSPERRAKEIRTLRRGSRSCLALSVVCAGLGLVQATTLALGG